MSKPGKRFKAAAETVDREKLYGIEEAVKLVKAAARAKFDETIEVALNLGVDPRHADQMVRGVVNLPKGTGKTVRVAVFAKGAKADEATAAGADVVGAERGDEHDRRAGARRGDRLIGPLAASRHAEVAAADGLARRRQAWHADRHVRVRAADDHDLGHLDSLERERHGRRERRRACGV